MDQLNTPRKVSFTYWSDPLCIWAFVAQEKLDSLLNDLGDHLDVRYGVVPVFGSVPWRFAEGGWHEQGVEGRISAMRKIASEHGHEITAQIWRDDPPASSWGPGAAIKAVSQLERDGVVDAHTCALYQSRLRERLFVHNKNIARRSVQLELAEELKVPRALVEEGLDNGSALALLWEDQHAKDDMKVRGSPTYVFDGGRTMIFGNFDYGVLQATARQFISGATAGCSTC